jgi:hypothetical protein
LFYEEKTADRHSFVFANGLSKYVYPQGGHQLGEEKTGMASVSGVKVATLMIL